MRTVTLTEIAAGFAGKTETASNERRIRRFFRDFSINPDFVSLFAASVLPEEKWLLTADRTEWEFGKTKINILMPAVAHKGVAIPLLWKLLTKKDDPDAGKKGSSNTAERKDLMKHFIRLFGKERIEAVAADREFIGNEWFQHLKENSINIASESGKIRRLPIPEECTHMHPLFSGILNPEKEAFSKGSEKSETLRFLSAE